MSLQYEVVVSAMERLPEAAGLQPPVGPPAAWSPLPSTLIYGASEVVLTDPPITTGQAEHQVFEQLQRRPARREPAGAQLRVGQPVDA
jgi:hypothetical protein